MTQTWLRGDWMQTYTGKRYYPNDPLPEEIDPLDIAHALSQLCRYGGHVDSFYSVAEHCLNLSYTVDPPNALHALLHDATEAYVVDVPRPVKRLLDNYEWIEEKVWKAIAIRFGISPVLPDQVLEHDNRILLDERKALMYNAEVGEWGVDSLEPLGIPIRSFKPAWVEVLYLNRLQELMEGKQ